MMLVSILSTTVVPNVSMYKKHLKTYNTDQWGPTPRISDSIGLR